MSRTELLFPMLIVVFLGTGYSVWMVTHSFPLSFLIGSTVFGILVTIDVIVNNG